MIRGQRVGLRYVDGLRKSISTLGLEQHATITGRIDEVHLDALYQRADVFVLPAENSGAAFEGFGLTYLEGGELEAASHHFRQAIAAPEWTEPIPAQRVARDYLAAIGRATTPGGTRP